MILPTNIITTKLKRNLTHLNINIVTNISKTTTKSFHVKQKADITSKAGIYEIVIY